MKVYGYCRISTANQNIERQVRNIKKYDSAAIIVKEVSTGTTFQGRKMLDNLLEKIESGDTIIFDSVSRMSRNSEEGFELYKDLYCKDVSLVFLKEPHINTETYKKAMDNQIELTGQKIDFILDGVNKYLLELAKEQIKIAFDQAEKEVLDLRQRTKEGIETAKLNGVKIGHPQGTYETKKSKRTKELIKKYNKDFGIGNLNDIDTMKLAEVSRKSYYKYKKELREQNEEVHYE